MLPAFCKVENLLKYRWAFIFLRLFFVLVLLVEMQSFLLEFQGGSQRGKTKLRVGLVYWLWVTSKTDI